MRAILIAFAFLVFCTPVVAQTGEDAPPPPQVDVSDTDPVDPDITILEEEDRVIYEYRSSEGQLLMVKVVPKQGKPYYLLDTDGDGELDTQQYDPRHVAVQMWELFRW